MRKQVMRKWKIYLLSKGNIWVEGSHIEAPRVGMCSNTIYLGDKTNVDANYKGCPHD